MALGLEPDSPEDIRDKGIIQMRLLQNDRALTSLNRYLELAPEADDVDDVLELIKSIKEKSIQ
jgi:regulator of sirC expression with transglutaminase-like and TPR domain